MDLGQLKLAPALLHQISVYMKMSLGLIRIFRPAIVLITEEPDVRILRGRVHVQVGQQLKIVALILYSLAKMEITRRYAKRKPFVRLKAGDVVDFRLKLGTKRYKPTARDRAIKEFV